VDRRGEALATAVSLAAVKEDDVLRKMELVRQSRLSVVPVAPAEWERMMPVRDPALIP
jgi:predicted RNA-binding protein with PUA-like domain